MSTEMWVVLNYSHDCKGFDSQETGMSRTACEGISYGSAADKQASEFCFGVISYYYD